MVSIKTLLIVGLMLTGQADNSRFETDSTKSAEAQQSIKLAREEAAKYTIRLNADGKAKLQLRHEPILRWTNHLRRRFYGDVFIWILNGRPEAVATITNSYGRVHSIETEAHSLSLATFTATNDGEPMWNPTRPGITLRRIPDAPQVADAPARRLQQMRGMARQFSAVSSPGPMQSQLRLMPQPVYRYASTTAELRDGAMFAFANGTDPEVFVLIEARQIREESRWHYAIARFNSHVVLQVTYKDDTVWTVPRLSGKTLKDPESPYFAIGRRIPPASEKGTDE